MPAAVAVGAALAALGSLARRLSGRRNRVQTARRPRMAAPDAPGRQPEAAPGAMAFDRFDRIRRAGGVKRHCRPIQGLKKAIEPDRGDEQRRRQATAAPGRPPNVATGRILGCPALPRSSRDPLKVSVYFGANRLFEHGERGGRHLALQAHDVVFGRQRQAPVAERFADDPLDGVARGGAGGEPLGDDQAQAGAGLLAGGDRWERRSQRRTPLGPDAGLSARRRTRRGDAAAPPGEAWRAAWTAGRTLASDPAGIARIPAMWPVRARSRGFRKTGTRT